jgi:hypothetical protein
MPGISFINGLMLAGLGALAIPILIHLLLKRKQRRLRFSTLRFFTRQEEQSSRRRRLRHWLLLALRLLIVLLLVLAFARPFLTESHSARAAQNRRQVIFLLDRSASLQATENGVARWSEARQHIRNALGTLQPDDRVALVACGARAEVVSGFAPPASVAALLADIEPTFAAANLGDGLQQVLRLLDAGVAGLASTVYVVSDLQRIACRKLAAVPLPPEVEVKVLSVGDVLSPNVAITELQAGTGEGRPAQAVITSFADEDLPALAWTLAVDGKTIASRSLALKAGAATNVTVPLPRLAPGWHTVVAALETPDALAVDNRRHAAWFVPEPTRALVVESRPDARLFAQESFFVVSALDPGQGGTNAVATAYAVSQRTPVELASQLSRASGAARYDLVIVPALAQLPPGSGEALAAFVREGGGLVLFLGEGLSANRCQAELGTLLPAELGKIEASAEAYAGWRIGEYDPDTPALAPFRRPHTGDLRIPQFTRRYRLSPLPGAATLASFDDGVPLLLTRTVGRGKVALVNTTADARWSDWPKHKTFVPWLHALGQDIAARAGHEPATEPLSLTVGEECDLAPGTAAKRASYRLRAPDGRETNLTADDQGRLPDADLTAPGVYTLCRPDGAELRRVAVNVPAVESDLAAMLPAEFHQQLARTSTPRTQTLSAALFPPPGRRRELSSLLLVGALVLLGWELLVANRTSA